MYPQQSEKFVTIDCDGRAWPWPHLHDFAERYVKHSLAKKMMLALEAASNDNNISAETKEIVDAAIWAYKE